MKTTYPLNETSAAAWRARLIESLLALREARVAFVEGVRQVLALANEAQERDKAFDLFVVIDSETDHLPPGHAVGLCSAAWLAACKQEEAEVEAYYRDAVNKQVDDLLLMLNQERHGV